MDTKPPAALIKLLKFLLILLLHEMPLLTWGKATNLLSQPKCYHLCEHSSAPNLWPLPPWCPDSILYRLFSLHLFTLLCSGTSMTPYSSLWALRRHGLCLICLSLDAQHGEHSINVFRLLHEWKLDLQMDTNRNMTPLHWWETTDSLDYHLLKAEAMPKLKGITTTTIT